MTADGSPQACPNCGTLLDAERCCDYCNARAADGSPAVAPEDAIRRALEALPDGETFLPGWGAKTLAWAPNRDKDDALKALAALVAERDALQKRAELAERQLAAVDANLGPWEPTPEAPNSAVGRVQTILNLKADRADRDALQEGFDTAQEDRIQLHRDLKAMMAERDSARRERGKAVDALRQIAAHPHGGILVNIAKRALVELGESKP